MDTAAANGYAHGYRSTRRHPVVLAHLRAWLREIVAEVLIDLELVCTELVANALEHATGPRHLRLVHHPDNSLVRVEVEDASPDLLPTPGTSRLSPHRGRGLRLIGALGRTPRSEQQNAVGGTIDALTWSGVGRDPTDEPSAHERMQCW